MKLKVSIIIGVIIIGVLCFNLFDDNKTSASIMNDVTKEEITDVVGVYIKEDDEYIKSDTIPESGYLLNESESYCRVNGEEDTNISISYNVANKTLSVTPLTTRGTKCYLYFDETLNGAILADNPLQTETPDFSKTAQADCTGIDNCEETNGLYQAEDDYGTTYYFRGSIDNNWVSFAGFYWRIIRINGDGSIRLIYSGDSASGPVETGKGTQIGASPFNVNYNRSEYVGLVYTEGEQHGYDTNSTIINELNEWFEDNLVNFQNKFSLEATYCSDREVGDGYTWSSQDSYDLSYRANLRIFLSEGNPTPTLKCSSVDLLSVKNNKLTYSIGLITLDEAALAGGVAMTNNTSYYLYNNLYYWTMTPIWFNGAHALVGAIYNDGSLNGPFVDDYYPELGSSAIRPVINLRADITITAGDGTIDSPYVIS